jgi:hypothetical protein
LRLSLLIFTVFLVRIDERTFGEAYSSVDTQSARISFMFSLLFGRASVGARPLWV